ncbi:DNA translocase FtsK 4TM domain-containing protein [Sphingomonas sp. CGMCC 1.13654]|uniref:DNA translocase FtsK n=1 Tax=Sphingomonas chungangi TaxID=2683589 RepID=A0A838L878_9SPHN|nr:DNA translocase FtsK 4TM domain-containing protein [Sphingomonas chungangi]MBA2935511.1 DNA translocase FtsK 4TM domain-containing protein [Sphingomonas chungangi]MVW57018.1 DNA translocase FtsK [Sphingomonas chungangi]
MAGSVAVRKAPWRDTVAQAIARSSSVIIGVALAVAAVLLAIALASYHRSDSALNTVSGGATLNWIGPIGAWAADALLTLFGPLAIAWVPIVLVPGIRLVRGRGAVGWVKAALVTLLALVFTGTAVTLFHEGASLQLPAGWGGAIGILGADAIDGGLSLIKAPGFDVPLRYAIELIGVGLGLWLWIKAVGLEAEEWDWLVRTGAKGAKPVARVAQKRSPRRQAAIEDDFDDIEDLDDEPAPAIAKEPRAPSRPIIADRQQSAPKKPEGKRQASLDLRDEYVLPSLDLLSPVPTGGGQAIDKAALERNARLLETVLDDFKVHGKITQVRPGPVVTMYELEPESGIKASRVVALADDVARNMSALSARIATIPGRTVIGIELPNVKREAVVFSEMVACAQFEDGTAQLPIILGKNIAGDPVVADLAPMPHLLVAGTTGSGKSVGLNCMIMSLLYRLTPKQCRMIMIDPKMLELSIYDDIPHLLSPVVTEPAKAVRALKWAVEQMEERYRMMSSVGVRSLASFNEKVKVAKSKGQRLGRRVQTGYDGESGHPVYEEEQLDYEVLPQIVVIVDELADLMMTAGKEVEFLIQRLAQKARAAGIHLIMATQRPSVDVITGVIKANLPTRISFAVTSKIDSRTILGEQGAEQLLGKGDMLYMPGGKQIARVHGPFVSDEEVRAVADHWRSQGRPDYISSVTEEPEDGGFALDGAPADDDSPDAALYRKAVQVVAESQKASTSYVQRQLRIGYNSAARLIERMEREGKVGAPDHVGRREVLIDRDGQPV